MKIDHVANYIFLGILRYALLNSWNDLASTFVICFFGKVNCRLES